MPNKKFINNQTLKDLTDQFPQTQDISEQKETEKLVKIAPLFKTQTMQHIITKQEKTGVIKTVTHKKIEKNATPPDIEFKENTAEYNLRETVEIKNDELYIRLNLSDISQVPNNIYILKIYLIYRNIIKEFSYPLLKLQNTIKIPNIFTQDYVRFEILKKSDSADTVIYISPRYNFVWKN